MKLVGLPVSALCVVAALVVENRLYRQPPTLSHSPLVPTRETPECRAMTLALKKEGSDARRNNQ